jgi:aldose 1-epimerase
MSISKSIFGKMPDGCEVDLYLLTNKNGMKLSVMTYGGTITKIEVPDKNGDFDDVVLGFDNLEGYIKDSPYFGCITGRYANRIANGRFTLDGAEYHLAKNNGPNHLHGGIKGFDKQLWDVENVNEKNNSILLSHFSPDGHENYPANLHCNVKYTLTDENELRIEYEAEADRKTIVNLTNHSYFNLAGFDSGDILNHQITINADSFTPVDKNLIPTGHILSVGDTALNFKKLRGIGSRIGELDNGYDHNFVLNKDCKEFGLAAKVYEPDSGRVMELFATQPGMQFYTGNFLDGSVKGKGAIYSKHAGFCLEPQHFPDSPNHLNFPSVVLTHGQKYIQSAIYKFSVIN